MAAKPEPVAVIGSACRLAGDASSPSALWDLLRDPVDLRQEIPASRFNTSGFYHPDGSHHGHTNVRHAYLLNDSTQHPANFDAEFFKIKPVEAKAMDPQQRFLLEVVYEGLEAAGLDMMGPLRGSDTGVYVGVMFSDYATMLLRDYQHIPTYYATGTGQSILSNRISHFFNWRGPSLTIDTACSSSLVAVHLAVQALRSGECQVALACGTNLILGPEPFIIESKLNMLSPDGRGRMWDEAANGYARGDGIAAVVLKPLSAALRDGDHIECVIRETGMNQDGAGSAGSADTGAAGITMPSAAAQEALIRSTYTRAGLDLSKPQDRPQYFEAHGTGTPAGDPVEAEAIHRAFFTDQSGRDLEDGGPLLLPRLYVGSIKTVVGHTEGTAGVAALIKTSLALQQGVVPPNLLFEQLSKRVEPYYKNLRILQRSSEQWPEVACDTEGRMTRRASVNSFGFGGTNAHAILESYDQSSLHHPVNDNGDGRPLFTPFVFSASSEQSLRRTLSDFAEFLSPLGNTDNNVEKTARDAVVHKFSDQDLSWTLRKRRTILQYRIAIAASSLGDLHSKLTAKLEDAESSKTLGAAIAPHPGRMRGENRENKILGVFTGQGAQYARMGAELIERSAYARNIITQLQSYLDEIIRENKEYGHPYQWSLEAEIINGSSPSWVLDPTLAQPICTALQILLVDLLQLAGVRFSAVVGHSSGEIAAAYAAGYLSAPEAMHISYYRGVCAARWAQSPNGHGVGIKGAMLAVGASMEDMAELCADEAFAGRVWVAASNSPFSVTLSGDEGAIEEIEAVLDDEDRFHRRLRVGGNMAYHSGHMASCYEPYVAAMRGMTDRATACSTMSDISVKPQCAWYSSVYDGQLIGEDMRAELKDKYWAENLTRPVMFSQAVNSAVTAADGDSRPFDAILEVGPHPALKRPTLETIKTHDLGTKDDDKPQVAYQGVLSRGSDAIGALSSALGALWSCMDTKSQPDLERYERAMAGIPSGPQHYYKLVKGLPTYRWDHSTKYWHESRISRKMRLRSQSPHPLLGEPTPDSSSLQHAIWRNLLRVSELEWLTGHAVQGQILFPAAGYLVSALEAARLWMSERMLQTGSSPKNNDIRLLELRDFTIHHAIPLDEDDDAGIEVLIQLADITGTTDTSVIRGDMEVMEAKFKYSAALPGRGQVDNLTLVASAQIIIEIGNSVPSLLPERAPRVSHTIDVEPERFYAALDDLGYNFSGQFRALTDLRRRKGKATCLIRRVVDMEEEHRHQLPLLIHPVELDAVLQSAILAYSYPYDEELRVLHLPTTIQQIRINPSALLPMPTDENVADSRSFFQVDASLVENFYHSRAGRHNDLVCNMDVFLTTPSIYSDPKSEPHAAIQVQGAEFRPIGGPSGGNGSHENRINLSQVVAENDRCMYSRTRWIPEQPDGIQAAKGLWHISDVDCKSESEGPESGSEGQLANLIERIALFYLRKFDREIGPDHPARTTFPTKYYLNYARHMLQQAEDGKHRWFKKNWRSDTAESILEISQSYMHMPDVEIMHLIGTQMPRVFAGHTTMLEELRLGGNDLLDRYYVEGIGPGDMGRWTGRVVKQITDRRPNLKILEVGAGTGSATKAILKKIGGHAFASYTYTDISPSFFENAAAVFAHHPSRDRMVFKTLDLEKDPAQQGFSEGAYDVVVAFCVLHATSDLERSLVHVRKLLKPGGYLVLSEVSDNGAATMGFIFGTFPGWWIGVDKGRVLSPLVSSKEWDMLVRRTGFSGVDTMPPSWVEDMFGMCAMISQAVDESGSFLRDPLYTSGVSPENISGNPSISNLLLVGGQNPEVTELVDEIQRVLVKSTDESPPLVAKVHRFDSLVSLMTRRDSLGAEVLASSIVLNLVELDCPVFQDITIKTFMALKSLLETAKQVLWVTSGRLCNEPYSNMTVAFGRVASYEFQDLSMQQLDIPQGGGADMAGHIVEALLRFHSDLEHKNDTFEREIVIDDTGRRFIPRLFFLDELNRRYNAGRKDVVREVDLAVKSDTAVALQPIFVQEDGGPVRYILEEQSRYKGDLGADCPGDRADEGSSSIELRLTHSIVSALKTPRSRSEFMVLGVPTDAWMSKQQGTRERVLGPKFLALVPSLASVIRVPMESVVPFDKPDFLNFGQALSATAAHLISISVLDRRFCGDTMVVHNAQQVPHMADALGMQAAIKGVEILYTIDSDSYNTWAEQGPLPDSWVRIPRYVSQSRLRQLLKMQEGFASAFVGLSSGKTGERSKVSEETVNLALRPQCETVMTTRSLFSPIATSSNIRHGSQSSQSNIRATLSRAVDCAMRQLNAKSGKSAARQDMALKDLLNLPSGVQSPLTVIDWNDTSSKLPVHLTRLDSTPMFKANKTYWLVGMSGDLGIALADWMVEKGVKNLVITSRRPAIAPEWIATHKHDSGATVTILACDVADQQALRIAHETIRATLPPIAGVIHGAMVLHDVSIHNMSFEQLTGVTGPKVNGSIYLDRIFGDSIELDFFVLTSSIISVIGNRGQANYAAANSFMASLAAQRRRRGLPTAVVHGGAIIGAGYMEREARRAWDRIAQNNFLLRLSEQDFVQSICEGIEACRLDRRSSPSEEATDVGWDLEEELCTGLNFLPVGHPNPPLWVTDPKFAHFLVRESTDGGGKDPEENMKGHGTLARVSILDLLQKCGTTDETHQVVRHAFATMLRNVLQVTLSDDDLMASRGSEIGLDSLVSVNIRSWFLKQLQVGIPVFKIMSNDYMESLVRLAIKGMPATLLAPRLQDHSTALSTSENEDKSSKIGTAEAAATARGDSSESSVVSSMVNGETQQTQTLSYSTTSSNWDRDSESIDAVPSPSASTGSHEQKAEEGCSINWDQETRPPADLLNIPLATNLPPPQTPPNVIVLTGATGLLGRNLVRYLLKHTSVQKIICVAVRSPSLPKSVSSRVEYHTGDLTLPLLGLTPPTLAEYIFNCADAVIHNGADTSHLKRYAQVRGSNLGSTLTLARLCLLRRIPLHYVSSAGVALLSGMDPFPPVSVGDHAALRLAKNGDGSFGYGYSKWVCERLLERTVEALSAGGQREWKVVIHRPSTIVRTGQDAMDDPRADLDWVNAMFKYARKSGITPVVQRNKGALDLVYVESVCQVLVEHLLRTDGGGDGVAYVNAVGDVVIPLDKLEEVEIAMGLEGARKLKPVRMDQWLAAAVADGVNPAVAALIEMIDEPHAIGSTYPRLLKSAAESDRDPSSSADLLPANTKFTTGGELKAPKLHSP